jgi:uncharacterized protein
MVPAGRQLLQGYGDGGFRIAGQRHEGSVLVFAEETRAWHVAVAEEITAASLEPVAAAAEEVEILVIGCGERFVPPPRGLRDRLREIGVALEWMDTGAACRTFNVLLTEGRPAAAALVAVS